jgi:rod shape-determining protein MreC
VFRKNQKVLVSVVLLTASCLLVFSRSDPAVPLKSQIVKLFALPIQIISFPFKEMKKILYYHRTFEEYMKLRREVTTLKTRLINMDEAIRENERLARLLEFKRSTVFSSIGANVIGRDPSNWNSIIIIDKGSKDKVTVGLPVVSALGVVGKVAEVSPDMSKVILLTDPSFSVVAITERSREVGLISGTLQGMCRMKYIDANVPLEIGDQIMTSKLSSSFPEGLLIGEVISINATESGKTIGCIVKPAVPLSQLEEVLVIRK